MRKAIIGVGFATTALVVGLFLNANIGVVRATSEQGKPEGTVHCEGYSEKSISGTGDRVEYTAPEGKVVTDVCVKRGNTHTPWFTNSNPGGCYEVVGINGNSIVVTRNKSGNQKQKCKDISHIDVKYEDTVTKSSFNLTSMCKVDESTGQMRVRNNSGEEQPFKLYKVGGGFSLEGVAPVGDTLYEVPWTNSSNTYKLEIGGYTYTKSIGNNDVCVVEETEEPVDEPVEEEKSTPAKTHSFSAPAPASAPQCSAVAPTKEAANPHVYRNGDTAVVKWFPSEGSHAHIYYKEGSSSQWQHAVRDIANSGYFEINGLGSKDWDFAVQQANDCAAGPISPVIIDGDAMGQLFVATPGLYVQ